MIKPIVRIHDSETNIIIEREMTDEEFTQIETLREESETYKAEAEAKAAAKAALLAQLGITEEQARLLLS